MSEPSRSMKLMAVFSAALMLKAEAENYSGFPAVQEKLCIHCDIIPVKMTLAGRVQRSGYALFVLMIAAFFVLFSVYVKASPGESLHNTSTVKIWTDPSRSFDQELKTPFLPFILLIGLPVLIVVRVGAQILEDISLQAVPRQWLVQPQNWLRPPPV